MHRCDYRTPPMMQGLASLHRQAKFAAHKCLRRRCAQTQDQFRMNRPDFGFKPWLASPDFRGARPLVDSPLAALVEFEMLHRVGHINIRAIDPGFHQGLVENAAGGTDKRAAFAVFLIARLFTDHEQASGAWTFAENRLGGVTVQIATPALARGLAQHIQTAGFWNERLRA
jgi:hypothetical protein